MRIGVEAYVFIEKEQSGVALYTVNLLTEAMRQMPQHEFVLACANFLGLMPRSLQHPKNAKLQEYWQIPRRGYNILLHLGLAPPIDFLLRDKTDLFIFPCYYHWPVLFAKKTIIFVFDTSFYDTPQYLVWNNRLNIRRGLARSLPKVDQVVVCSEYTKKRLIEIFDRPESQITVIYPSIDLKFFKPSDNQSIEKIRDKYAIGNPYILFISTLEPRKNIIGLLHAYEKLPEVIRSRYSLILAGGRGWKNSGIHSAIHRLQNRGLDIRTLGYIEEIDKPSLLSGASVFVYPSHYEGFGIPIIEAMACGTPVVAADNTSLPEAAGDAAFLVPATDYQAISAAIQRILTDVDIQKDLRLKGFKQASRFSLEKSGHQFVEMLSKISNE